MEESAAATSMLDVYDHLRKKLEDRLRRLDETASSLTWSELTDAVTSLHALDRLHDAEFRRPRELPVHHFGAPDVEHVCGDVANRLQATGHSDEVCEDAVAAVRGALTP